MKNMPPIFDYAAFEIRYGSGQLYFDRCGQSLLDIDRQCPGWTVTAVDLQTGRLENPSKSLHAAFNDQIFNFIAEKASKLEMREIAKEICGLWNIIQANLGLDEFFRMALRLNYLLPTESDEEAERRLKNSEISIIIPQSILSDGYGIKNRQIIVMLVKDDTEYRVEMAGVTRYEGLAPSDLVRTDPRLLSKKQKEFRIAKLKQMAEYSANPMFAVNLNVDCVRFNPQTLSVEEFILKQAQAVEQNFLPILRKL
jgi:hypothetical protein